MKYYSEDHEWVEVEGDEATVGISSYAAEQLGEIIYVGLPEEDVDFTVGDVLGTVESEKAISDVYAPVSGTVSAINETLLDDPGLVNESAEEHGWLCKLVNIDTDDLADMMTEASYERYLRSLEKECSAHRQ